MTGLQSIRPCYCPYREFCRLWSVYCYTSFVPDEGRTRSRGHCHHRHHSSSLKRARQQMIVIWLEWGSLNECVQKSSQGLVTMMMGGGLLTEMGAGTYTTGVAGSLDVVPCYSGRVCGSQSHHPPPLSHSHIVTITFRNPCSVNFVPKMGSCNFKSSWGGGPLLHIRVLKQARIRGGGARGACPPYFWPGRAQFEPHTSH